LCKFFGWGLNELRNLKMLDYNAAIQLYNEDIREQKKTQRQHKKR